MLLGNAVVVGSTQILSIFIYALPGNNYNVIVWKFCSPIISCFSLILFYSLLLLKSFKSVAVTKLWKPADSGGWRASSAPRSYWPRMSFTNTFVSTLVGFLLLKYFWHSNFNVTAPRTETNGYLKVRCNGGLNQQRSAVWSNFFLYNKLKLILLALTYKASIRLSMFETCFCSWGSLF